MGNVLSDKKEEEVKGGEPERILIEVLEVFIATTLNSNPNRIDPFYVTIQLNDKLIINYMIDSGASINIMPLSIMKDLVL